MEDVEKDILEQMAFRPLISKDLRSMDARVFRPERTGLDDRKLRNIIFRLFKQAKITRAARGIYIAAK